MKGEENKNIMSVDYNDNFRVEITNLLDNPSYMIMPGYEKLDMSQESNNILLDTRRITDETTVIVIFLKYYEYLCSCYASFSYIKPLLQSGLNIKDVIWMIKHHLKTTLIREVGNAEQVSEIHIEYYAKIKY